MSISSEYESVEKSEIGVPHDVSVDPQEDQSHQDDVVAAMSFEDENDRSVEHIESISSFLPLLQRLPGLRLVDGSYFQYGDLSKEDIQDLCAFSRTIGSFTLTDDGKSAEYPIPPGTLLRLQYFHTRFADAPLFPSMRHLRLEAANSSLQYLDFFLSSPLKSFEMVNVVVPHQTPVAVFLENVVKRGTDLSRISLGPGSITQTLLQACLKFDHLQKLEFKDSLPSLDYALLKQFGDLPLLEALVLNAEACRYESPNAFPPAQEPSTAKDVEDGVFDSPQLSGDWYDDPPKSPCMPTWEDGAQPEPSWDYPNMQATPLRIPSPVPFEPYPAQTSPAQTPHPPQEPELPDVDNLKVAADSEAFIPVSIVPEPSHEPPKYFSHLKKLHVIGQVALMEDLLTLVSSQDVSDISLSLVLVKEASQPPRISRSTTLKKKKKGSIASEKVQLPIVASPSPGERFFKVLEGGLSKWATTITGVLIRKTGASLLSDSTLVELPSSVFHACLLSNSLKKLDIRGWSLPTLSESLQGLSSRHEPTSPKLEALHLPIDNPHSGISFVELRSIARAYPRLISLRCNLNKISDVPSYGDGEPSKDCLHHGLQLLSIGNSTPHADPRHLLHIARYLNTIFPKLEKIEAHPGHNEEQWAYIGDLIKLHRNMSSDDAIRASLVS